jgi:hypothetical protein
MSLRAAVRWRRSNLLVVMGIASGERTSPSQRHVFSKQNQLPAEREAGFTSKNSSIKNIDITT